MVKLSERQMMKLAMIEHRGLQFILSKLHRAQYLMFLKQDKAYKQKIRIEASKYSPAMEMCNE